MRTEERNISFVPHAYYGTTHISGVTNAYTDENSTTYAEIGIYRLQNRDGNFLFNTSSLPTNLHDITITCNIGTRAQTARLKVRQSVVYRTNLENSATTQYIASSDWYTPTSEPNDAGDTGTKNIRTLTSTAVTNDMLSHGIMARYEYSGYTGSGSQDAYKILFYGATLTVTHNVYVYSINCASLTQNITLTSSSNEVDEGGSVTYTLTTPYFYKAIVLDNGVDITSNFTGSNGVYTYTVNNINEDHNVVASVTSPLLIKWNGGWQTPQQIYVKGSNGWNIVSDYNTLLMKDKVYISKKIE